MDKLGQCYFQHFYCGDLGSNAIAEQENSALKRDCMGPQSNSGIDQSVKATLQHENKRLRDMLRYGLLSLSQTAIEDSDASKDTDTNEDDEQNNSLQLRMKSCERRELSKVLVDKALNDLILQYEASGDYKCYAASTHEFLVRRFKWAMPAADPNNMVDSSQIPKFDRTRIVKISNGKS